MTSNTDTTPLGPGGAATADAECLDLTRTLRRRGAAVFSVFAVVWALAGASGVASALAPTLVGAAVAVAVTAAVLVVAFRGTAGPVTRPVRLPERWQRGIGLVNGIQLVVIFAVIAASNASGHPAFIPVGICLVVGLHFFPLARLYDQRQYTATAALLTALAVVGFGLLLAGMAAESVRAVVGLGAALVLWGSALHVGTRG
ncbi:hypothetical protein [Streptomyces laurentii]|uniref:hypothetical protein n=1 Tax=Streptomyces laurentii TaxID=39478 RepID=UPI00368D774E